MLMLGAMEGYRMMAFFEIVLVSEALEQNTLNIPLAEPLSDNVPVAENWMLGMCAYCK